MTTAHPRRHRGRGHRARAAADVLVDGERIVALLAPGDTSLGVDLAGGADTVIDATGKYVVPGGDRLPHPHGAAVRRDVRLATPSRPARGRRPGAARRRSSTSPCSAPASGCRTGSPPGTTRPTATARSTTASTRSSAASTTTRSRRWTSWSTRASPASSCSWPTRASSTPTTARSCGPCRRPPSNGALIMMHAENGIGHRRPRRAGARPRRDRTRLPRARPGRGRPRRRPPTARSCWPHLTGAPLYVVHMSAKQAVATARRGPRRGLERLRRDLPAVPLPVARGAASARRASRAPSGSARRRCGRARRATRTSCGATCAPATSRVVSTDHCPFCMKEQKELGLGDFSKIPNGIGGGRAPDGPALPGRRRRAGSRSSAGSSCAAPRRRGCSGCTRARA